MKGKRPVGLAVCFALILSLCGCDLLNGAGDELLAPPKLSGEMATIQAALDAYAGDDYTLEYPATGDHRSAIVLEDISGSGRFEALAFYSTVENDQSFLHLNVIVCRDGVWESAAEQSLAAGGVDRVGFADLDRDGQEEILVGWEIYGGSEKQLGVYSFLSGELKQWMLQPYTTFSCGDLNGCGRPELLVESLLPDEQRHTAALYELNGDGTLRSTECAMDGTVKTVSEPQWITLATGRPAVLFEETKGLGAISEILLCDGEDLVNPLLDPETGKNTVTLRTSALVAEDLDGDGFLEIPTESVLPNVDPKSAETFIYTAWCRFDGKALNRVAVTVSDVAAGYRLWPPERWIGSIAVQTDTSRRLCGIYAYDAATKTVGEKLLDFRTVKKGSYHAETQTNPETVVWESDGYLLLGRPMPATGPLAVTQEEWQAMLR